MFAQSPRRTCDGTGD
uniref:Uncharacterized protein n=1 Tax=Arundo donax TaxID=35708 RepID=A0A0A9AI18_ARUDO